MLFSWTWRIAASEVAFLFLASGIQLLGEESFSILPFLALLWLLHTRWSIGRRWALLCAVAGCSLWFAAAHLPTYGWDVVQVIAVIGLARVILLLGYLTTKNILVSFGAHLFTDWSIFALILLTRRS